MFWVLGGWFAIAEPREAYSVRAAVEDWPAGEVGEWVADPAALHGRGLPSRRWRSVRRVVDAGATLAVPGSALGTGDVEQQFADGRNPFAVEALPTSLRERTVEALSFSSRSSAF